MSTHDNNGSTSSDSGSDNEATIARLETQLANTKSVIDKLTKDVDSIELNPTTLDQRKQIMEEIKFQYQKQEHLKNRIAEYCGTNSYQPGRKDTSSARTDIPANLPKFGQGNDSIDDPNEFRIDRANGRQHLAFGTGIHSCAGAPLARAETHATLVRFLERMSDIRISEEHHGPPEARCYEYDPTYMLRGLRELHVEFDRTGT